MSCSQCDLKAFFLGELKEPDRRLAEEHLKTCQGCRDELERLRMTGAALMALADEEVPRRIAFVSDKVFEPSRWRRFWNAGPRLAFASAAMLSLAILVHAFVRPAPVTAPPPAATVDTAALEARIQSEVTARVQTLVEKAAAESAVRQEQKSAELLEAVEKRLERQRRADMLLIEDSFEFLRKNMNLFRRASYESGGIQ